MTAITKSWTDIADAAIDPDSPVDQALMTANRDNIIFVKEWMGESYEAGAVQDHNHDGVNSAEIETGPIVPKNASFESGEAGITFVDSADGSHAIETTNVRHGAQAMSFTSVTLANGGSQATWDQFVPIAQGDRVQWRYWRYGSVANISSLLQVVWYQKDKSTVVSTEALNLDTATVTAYSMVDGVSDPAPANARFYRLAFTGGVPAVGTAVGTIYADGFAAIDLPRIQEHCIRPSAVNQVALKTATAAQSVSIGAQSSATIVLTGGTYSFLTYSADIDGASNVGRIVFGGGNTAAGTVGYYNNHTTTSYSAYVDGRYISSSPPWRFGSGPTETDEIELFAMLILERATGKVLGVSVAQDPPWAYNGPTIITPTHNGTIKDADGNDIVVPMRREIILPHTFGATKGDPAKTAAYDTALANKQYRNVAIDMDYKNRDMALIPHCWPSGSALDDTAFPTAVAVMLDPFNPGTSKLAHLLDTGENVYEIFEGNFLNFKQPIAMPGGPPGVEVIDWGWKP